MGRGCADSLESQEFPIIIPLPLQQRGGRKHWRDPSACGQAQSCQRWPRGAGEDKEVQGKEESSGGLRDLLLTANQGPPSSQIPAWLLSHHSRFGDLQSHGTGAGEPQQLSPPRTVPSRQGFSFHL